MKKNRFLLQIIIFISLIFESLLFLLSKGSWFYQDASNINKTSYEFAYSIYTQLHVFSNLKYYIGYNIGLFIYTRILIDIFYNALHLLFPLYSQYLMIFLSLIISVASVIFFFSIFIRNKSVVFLLGLLYVFNPLFFGLLNEDYLLIYATVPLFLFSFTKFYFQEKTRFIYLVLNIISVFFMISYVRLMAIDLLLVGVYTLYFITSMRHKLQFKKIILILISYSLVFLPLLFSFISQQLSKSKSIFNYANVIGLNPPFVKFADAFSMFHAINIPLYTNNLWTILGISLFIFYLFLLNRKKSLSPILLLNLFLILFSITLYATVNIFGSGFYPLFSKLFPFILNEPSWSFYIFIIPFLLSLGILVENRVRLLFISTIVFITFTIAPLLNLSNFVLQKYNLVNLPSAYRKISITSKTTIPEATDYFPDLCWRATYMDKANVPTMCINFGLTYAPISYNNPRVLSGKNYYVSSLIPMNTNIDNLRVTHNLKNIIVANDISNYLELDGKLVGGNPIIKKVANANNILKQNRLLKLNGNKYYDLYYFANKNNYDFYIYSPKTVVYKDSINSIFDNSLNIMDTPVVIDNTLIKLDKTYQSVKVSYKIDPLDPTKYPIELSDVNTSKPFLLQLNQSFDNNWDVYWVNKNNFNSYKCTTNLNIFNITNNTRCMYADGVINLNDMRLLFDPSLNSTHHFQSNYINNGWLITPNDIPKKMRNSKNLYMVLVYKEQIYYSYTILISGLSIALLFLFAIYQEIRTRIRRIKQK